MERVPLTKLSQSVRSFLFRVKRGKGLLVEDAKGRARYGVIPYTEATAEEKRSAWKRIEQVQEKVRRQMEKRGATEAELDRILQEDT